MGPQWCRGTDDIIMVQIITDYVLDYTEWHFPVPRFARINSTNNKINGGKKIDLRMSTNWIVANCENGIHVVVQV